MFLTRNGYFEETFFTFSLSPIRDESGGIGGLFHPVTETTATMLAERRTRALRELGSGLSAAIDEDDVARRTVDLLAAFEYDLPFLVYYRFDEANRHYQAVAGTHLHLCETAFPERLAVDDADQSWLPPGAREGAITEITDIVARLEGCACGPYDELPQMAFAVPIVVAGAPMPPALLVVGVSPRLPLTEDYRGFYQLLRVTIANALATVRALEDEKRRTEALAAIDHAKTAFFSNVSHEFRTPLTLMLGPLEEMAVDNGHFDDADRQKIVLAHRNGLRLLRLVNSLLDFSRIEAGRVEASYQATDIAAVTADLASTFRSATERAGLDLVIETEPVAAPVYLDRDMWEKVVLNLLSNAFKFTHHGTITVHVGASDDGTAAEVTVRDTGTGIPANAVPRLFERFYRVESAQGRSFEGSGIGLAMVMELVDIHGGTLRVDSVEGKGSAFTVSIPTGVAHLPADKVVVQPGAKAFSPGNTSFLDEAVLWLHENAAAAKGVIDVLRPDRGARPPGRRQCRHAGLCRAAAGRGGLQRRGRG